MDTANRCRAPDGEQSGGACHYGARASKHPIGAKGTGGRSGTRASDPSAWRARGGNFWGTTVLRGTTARTDNPSPRAAKTGRAATGLVSDW